MKAYELQDKRGLDSVTRTERPDPHPGPGQVLIRMRAWSLNFRDLSVARGAYGGAPTKDLIPLSDGVGEIVEVGAGVTRVKPGDRAKKRQRCPALQSPLGTRWCERRV